MKRITWILRLIPSIIFIQTLYFKFTGAEESRAVFLALNLEPYGRIGVGVVELIAAVLILIPRTSYIGALIGTGILLGAVFSHLFILGIEVNNDGGLLFVLAVTALVCCVFLVFQDKKGISNLINLKS
jgi:uncharacterized membrane protein YphA (DoxX/SURF4 family)